MEHSDEKRMPDDHPAYSDHESTRLHAEDLINTSGHVQELDRTWGIWAIAGQALIADNAWAAGSGALVVS